MCVPTGGTATDHVARPEESESNDWVPLTRDRRKGGKWRNVDLPPFLRPGMWEGGQEPWTTGRRLRDRDTGRRVCREENQTDCGCVVGRS